MRIVRHRPENKQNRLNHNTRNASFAKQHKSKFEDLELQAMQRSPARWKYRGNLFCKLTEELLWKKFIQKSS